MNHFSTRDDLYENWLNVNVTYPVHAYTLHTTHYTYNIEFTIKNNYSGCYVGLTNEQSKSLFASDDNKCLQIMLIAIHLWEFEVFSTAKLLHPNKHW